MTKGIPGVVKRLRLIAVHKTDGPWGHLVNDLAEVAKSVYLNEGYDANIVSWPVFRDWFPGWFMMRRKIEATLDWVDRMGATCKFADSSEEDAAVTNYLKKVITTAVHEFDRENRGRTYATVGSIEKLTPQVLPNDNSESMFGKTNRISKLDQENLRILRNFLASLPPENSVPFLLRYYEALGPLLDSEVKWLTEKCGLSEKVVVETIESALNKTRKPVKGTTTLAADLIGDLCGIPPSANGSRSSVDQRISRVKKLLIEEFGKERS